MYYIDMLRTLNWMDFAEKDPFHVVRVQLPSQIHVSEHTHRDYAELFLVESGRITHRINNRRRHLEKGTLVLIRPGDIHHLKMEKAGCKRRLKSAAGGGAVEKCNTQ